MKHIQPLLLPLLLLPLLFVSCIDEETYEDTATGNFEALWRIIDEHYCYFDYKKEVYGLDWQEVHDRYKPHVKNSLTTTQQFELLSGMLGELRDGHVNLSSGFDYGRYWRWHEDYPTNFSDTLLRRYLGTDYHIASSLRYKVLDDNIGYVYCSSFASGFGDGNLTDMLSLLLTCDGLIVDIRGNGGGQLDYAERLAQRFTNTSVHVGYLRHKNGRGHSDFSPMQKQTIDPYNGLRWQKRTVVLTNREVFSAANEFVKYMKCFPGVTVVGDSTGGGSGLPMSSELPGGWSVRYSACPMYDRDGRDTEFGIAPDHFVSLTDDDFARGRDTLIEFARQLLKQ